MMSAAEGVESIAIRLRAQRLAANLSASAYVGILLKLSLYQLAFVTKRWIWRSTTKANLGACSTK